MTTPTAITPLQLGQAQPTDANVLLVYTVPALTQTAVQTIDICNTGASARLIRVFFVPSGGAAGVTNAIIYDMSLAGNSTLTWTGPQYLGPAAFISVQVDGANAVTFTISGLELAA